MRRHDVVPGEPGSEAGFSLIEVIVAGALALVVLIAAYDFLDWTNRGYMKETGLADAQNAGRATMDLFVSDLRNAGYSPTGRPYYAIPGGDATKVRVIADLDGDGAIGTPGEADENVTYQFVGPGANGTYKLIRAVDLNEDWVYTGTGESSVTVAENLVQVDNDSNGTIDPFFQYDIAPAAGTVVYNPTAAVLSRVTINFGVRSANRDPLARSYPVVNFGGDVALRSYN